MSQKYAFFDLDGTITDSSPGIVNSLQHSLKKQGIENISDERLKAYIGASLKQIFAEISGNKDEQYLEQGVEYYREYYKDKGIFENYLYEGIGNVLSVLKAKGVKIGLATAKPTYFAKIILEHFGIEHYFDVLVGSHLDGTRTNKKEIIYEVMDRFGWPNAKDCFMIGDRTYDIEGGKFHNVKTIGARYGYGKSNEYELVKPDFEAEKPEKILDFI